MLFEEAVMLYASETLSQEVTLVPSIRILWLLSQLPFLYVTCNIQIARRTRFTVHCIHCLTARREPATLPAVFLRGRESKRGREISFFYFFFLIFSQADALNPGFAGSSYKPRVRSVKTHLFPRQPDAAQALGSEKKAASNTSGPVTRRKEGGEKIQITDKSNHIRLFLMLSTHTPLHRSDSRRPELL